MTLLTAAQWFMVAGALMFVFGVGLLSLVITGGHRRRRRPVRTITRLRLHELSVDTHPGPYARYGAGFEVVADQWAAPPRTARPVPARTVVMPRVAPPQTRRPR